MSKKMFYFVFIGLCVLSVMGCNRQAKEEATVMEQSTALLDDAQTGQQTATTMAAAVGGDQSVQGGASIPAAVQGQAPAAQQPYEQVITSATSFEKPTVERIQEALKNAGLYTGTIDGKMGPKTQKAIEDFQSQNGLAVDGKIGPKTWAKLSSHLYAANQPL